MEIPDAYQEYVQTRREGAEAEKIATLKMPVDDLAAVTQVVDNAVANTKNLSIEATRRWESILRSLAKSVYEAA